MTAPTGRQLELTCGDTTASVVELGAALRALSVDGRALVDGFEEDEPLTGGRGQHCTPWPNRVRDGRWSWHGTEHQLDISEPSRGTALHGLVRWRPWDVVEQTASSSLLRTVLHPQPGWPGTLGLTVRWQVSSGSLSCEVGATNLGAAPCPFGYAAHPYLTAGTPTLDEAHLELPAGTYVRVDDERLLPLGIERVDGTAYDFRAPRALRDAQLDTCFGSLSGAAARLTAPDGTGVQLDADEAFRWRQVYTGDDLPELPRRRRGLALEPMTCPPDALRTGENLVVLEPGDSWQGTWTLRAIG